MQNKNYRVILSVNTGGEIGAGKRDKILPKLCILIKKIFAKSTQNIFLKNISNKIKNSNKQNLSFLF